jgi:Zn-dependent metalloprotease
MMSVAMVLAAAGLASSAAADGVVPADPTQRLIERYPGLVMHQAHGRPELFAGVPMSSGLTDQAAAEAFLRDHVEAFGFGRPDLRVNRVDAVDLGRFTVFVYDQFIDGVKVEKASLRVLVLNQAVDHRVVLASASLGQAPSGGLAEASVAPEAAIAKIRGIARFAALEQFSTPEIAVFAGLGDFDQPIAATRVWKFQGEIPDLSRHQKWTFFVDASSGELLHARNEVLHTDVSGVVRARATPGLLPDTATNPPVLTGMPQFTVRVQGGSPSVFSDRSGNALLDIPGTSATIESSFAVGGQWFRVVNSAAPGTEPTGSILASVGVPFDLQLNTAPTEANTAAVNAFLHANLARNFFRDRAPTFTALDTILPANVQVSGTCNAFYNGSSINFYPAGGGCNNTAFSTVVAHEYGHHIVNRLSLAQNAFGEGFSDAVAILLYDTGIVGQFFTTSGGAVRNPEAANQQFPCASGAIHTCGQILGGTVRELRNNYVTRYGQPAGLTLASQQFVSWALITLGQIDSLNPMGPRSLTEWLTIDDNDGNLSNGSPNYCDIVNAFGQHGIPEPAATAPVAITYPAGRPATLTAGAPTSFTVNVAAAGGTPTANSGRLFFRRGSSGSFTEVPMTVVNSSQYLATIPAQTCGTPVEYYVTVGSSAGVARDPAAQFCAGGASQYVASVSSGSTTSVTDDFEIDRGWTVASTATTGQWLRADPVGTNAGGTIGQVQPEDDVTIAPGVNCFVTGNGTPGGAVGAADVDGGSTTLTSPAFNLTGAVDATISYSRWYSNNGGSAPESDTFLVEVSVNNGGTWVRAETVGPSGPEVRGGWRQASWTLSSLGLAPSGAVRVRFIAQDTGNASVVEAAIDEFRIVRADCTNPCLGDWDGNGELEPIDVRAFFDDYRAGDADADGNGETEPLDITVFFNAYRGGC